MRLRYDPESDALYFRLQKGEIEETLELPTPGGYVDVGPSGQITGLEFLSVQEFLAFLMYAGGEISIPDRIEDREAFIKAMDHARAVLRTEGWDYRNAPS